MGIILLLVGFTAGILFLVFVCIDELRKTGLILLIVSIVCLIIGFEECSNFHIGEDSQSKADYCRTEKDNWKKIVTKNDVKSNNHQLYLALKYYKRKLNEKELEQYSFNLKKHRAAFTPFVLSIGELLEKEDYALSTLFFSHKQPMFEHYKYTKLYLIKQIGKDLFYAEGLIVDSSNALYFCGYLNTKSRSFYFENSDFEMYKYDGINELNCDYYNDFFNNVSVFDVKKCDQNLKLKTVFYKLKSQNMEQTIFKVNSTMKLDKKTSVLEGTTYPIYAFPELNGKISMIFPCLTY